MEELPQPLTSESIVIPKKILTAFIAGIIFTTATGVLLWKVNSAKLQVQNTTDNKEVVQDKTIPTTGNVDIKNTTFISGYPNFGKYKGLPIGPWFNLDNNMVPDIRGNVAVIAHIVHYQGFTRKTLPILQGIYEQNKDKDTIVVAINNKYIGDAAETDSVKVQQTLNEDKVTFPVVIDRENTSINFADTFKNQAYPGILIVDKFGNVRYTHPGAGDFEKLYMALKDIQIEEKQSPPSIESLVNEHKDEILKSKDLQTAFSIERNSVSKIGDSVFYIVGLTIFKREVDRTQMLRGEDLENAFVVLGKTSEGKWIVGVPHDENYCVMLKQANLSEKERKSYEMIKCGTDQ